MTLKRSAITAVILVAVVLSPIQAFLVEPVSAQAGSEDWRNDLGTGDAIEQITTTESSNLVYAVSNGTVYAYSKSDGTLQWSGQADRVALDSSRDRLYAVIGTSTLEALDPDTGTTLDTTSISHTDIAGDMAVDESTGNVYVGTFDNLRAYDSNLNILWTNSGRARAIAVNTDTGDILASGDNGGVNAETRAVDSSGTTVWSRAEGTDGSAGEAVYYSSNYYQSEVGELYQYDSSSGTETQIATLSSNSGIGVDSDNGEIYFHRNGDTLGSGFIVSYNVSSGTENVNISISTDGQTESMWVGETQQNYVKAYYADDDAIVALDTGQSSGSVVSGNIENTNFEPLSGATVEAIDDSGTVVATTTSASDGSYSFELIAGTYTIRAVRSGYATNSTTVNVTGPVSDVNVILEQTDELIELQVRNYMDHDTEADYRVVIENESGRFNKTVESNVTSSDSSIVSVDSSRLVLVSTSNQSINQQVTITANYTDSNGDTFITSENVTVANKTVDNIGILPPWSRVGASINDQTIQVIIVATMFGGVVGLLSRSFAGLATMTLVMTLGWLGGYVGDGMVVVSLLIALFIGLNTAANIDYTVQR